MNAIRGSVIFLMAVSLQAATKYNCALLTPADIKDVVGVDMKEQPANDVPIAEGPAKGETMSLCSWTAGETVSVLATVSRGPRTPQERTAWLNVKPNASSLPPGWKFTSEKIAGGLCLSYMAPPNSKAPSNVACWMEAKGKIVGAAIVGSKSAIVAQAKVLTEKAAARLP
jgi:hypothetical protein